jgi:lipid A 3-O-deacylase
MFIKSFFLLTVTLSLCSLLYAQHSLKSYNKELTVITENDNYNFTLRDRYYTNGLFFRFNWLAKKTTDSSLLKTINRVETGQMLYNSYYNRHSVEMVLTTMDRPYAGWLYASYGQTKIYSNQDVLMYDGVLGVVGPAALGKQVQTGFHRLLKLYDIYGWEYQVKNEIGLNASVQYYRSLVKKKPGQNLTLHAVRRAMLGNTFTNASAGLLLKFGKTEQEENSTYWCGRLGDPHEKSVHKLEALFFLEPTLMAQAYNATVQGGLFRSDKGLYISHLNPVIYLVKGGAVISTRQAALSITYTLKQKEAKSMIDKMEFYGAFGVSFRFR